MKRWQFGLGIAFRLAQGKRGIIAIDGLRVGHQTMVRDLTRT